MSMRAALEYLTRQPDDPTSGWLAPERIRAAVQQVYLDMARAPERVVEQQVIERPPIGRSSSTTVLPQLLPSDGWVTVEHHLGTEEVIAQVSHHGLVIPSVTIRIVGPNSVAVQASVDLPGLVRVIVLR